MDLLQEEMVAIKSERDYLENNVIELQKKLVNLQHLHDPVSTYILLKKNCQQYSFLNPFYCEVTLGLFLKDDT